MGTQAQDAGPTGRLMGLNWWTPVIGWQAAYNSKLQETFVALASEWQAFIGRRMTEDLSVLQQVAGARSPDQLWQAYAKFWQNAAADYAQEYAIMAKLAGTCLISGAAVAEQTLRAGPVAPPLSKAA